MATNTNQWFRLWDKFDEKQKELDAQRSSPTTTHVNTSNGLDFYLDQWQKQEKPISPLVTNALNKPKQEPVVDTRPVKWPVKPDNIKVDKNAADKYLATINKYWTWTNLWRIATPFAKLHWQMLRWELSPAQAEQYTKAKADLNKQISAVLIKSFTELWNKQKQLEWLINNPDLSEAQKRVYKKELDSIKKEQKEVANELVSYWVVNADWSRKEVTTSTQTEPTQNKTNTTTATTTNTPTTTNIPTPTTTTKTWATTTSGNAWAGIVGQLQWKGLTAQETSFDNRKLLANNFWISNYEWTKEQNQQLEKLMKEKSADEIRAVLKWETPTEAATTVTEAKKDEPFLIPWINTVDWVTEVKPQEATVDIWGEDIALEEMAEDIKKESVHERNLTESISKYTDAINVSAAEKERILTEAWAKEKELLENQNLDQRARAAEREKFLNEILWEFKTNVDARRWDITAATQRSKDAAWLRSRIAWAIAGQSWRGLSASAVGSIQDSILWLYDQQISDAEFQAIRANTELDQALRDTWLSVFQNQTAIDTFIQALDVQENAPLINALNEATKWNVQAQEDVKNFVTELYSKQAEEDQNRVLQERRIEATEEAYKEMSPEQKLAYLYDINKNVDWFDFIADELMTLIPDYADLPYNQLQTKIRKEAWRANQSNILSNSLIQKPYSELSDSEKRFMNYILDRWMDTYIRWDNSVEITKEVTDRFNRLQAEWEENEWEKLNIKTTTETPSTTTPNTTQTTTTPSAEAIASEWSFKWFKSKALSDRYDSKRKELSNFIKWLTEEQKVRPDIIEKIKEANDKLNQFKTQNSI